MERARQQPSYSPVFQILLPSSSSLSQSSPSTSLQPPQPPPSALVEERVAEALARQRHDMDTRLRHYQAKLERELEQFKIRARDESLHFSRMIQRIDDDGAGDGDVDDDQQKQQQKPPSVKNVTAVVEARNVQRASRGNHPSLHLSTTTSSPAAAPVHSITATSTTTATIATSPTATSASEKQRSTLEFQPASSSASVSPTPSTTTTTTALPSKNHGKNDHHPKEDYTRGDDDNNDDDIDGDDDDNVEDDDDDDQVFHMDEHPPSYREHYLAAALDAADVAEGGFLRFLPCHA